MHWAFYTWQTFLNWENYGQEWYSLRSYGSWCHLMPSWRMPCTVMTTWFHIVFTTTSVLYLYSSFTVTIQSLFDTTSHARLAPIPLQVGEVSHQNERFFLVNSIPLQYFLREWHSLWYSKPTAGELGEVWFALQYDIFCWYQQINYRAKSPGMCLRWYKSLPGILLSTFNKRTSQIMNFLLGL